jgi:hypothetical protein
VQRIKEKIKPMDCDAVWRILLQVAEVTFAMLMKAVRSSESLVSTYECTQRNNPEHHHPRCLYGITA